MSTSRRDFLKTTSIAAGGLALTGRPPLEAVQKPRDVRISSESYRPSDYSIKPIRYSDVVLQDAFWKSKVALNATVTIPFEVRKLTDGGREFGNNVLEAAILSLQTHPDDALQAQIDARISTLRQRPARGNNGFEVAATYYKVTGRRDLLDKAVEAAEALYQDFRTNNPPFSGGERDSLNCAQLYRVTQDRKHLDLAKHYLDIRGLENSVNRSRHNQSYKPVLEQTEAVGHAVNCATLMLSLADVGVLTGRREYLTAAQRMWTDAVHRKMYITGGIGTTGNEGFGEPYSLPNISAYAETCAVLMFITLSHRLFLASGDSRYIDVLERGMYNNALSGVSVSGDHYFYVNRLASAGDGRDQRWQRASLECCPPNLVRFLASMPGYIYAQGPGDAIYVNLYLSSEAPFAISGGTLRLAVDSDMPWGGKSKITVAAERDLKATVKLRVPGWARNQVLPGHLYSYVNKLDKPTTVSINGSPFPAMPDQAGYVSIDRQWKNGDVIEVAFPIETRWVAADERVRENRGRMAVERGPIVYCVDEPHNEGGQALGLLFDRTREIRPGADREFFGGVTVLRTEARPIASPSRSVAHVTLVPYYLWANRGPGEMAVWLSTREYAIGDTGPAGGLIFHVNPNHAADGWRYLEAAPFDQSAGAKWGCFRQLIPGARGTAIGTGKQNTADMLAACPEPGTAAQLCATLKVNGITGWFLPSRDELAAMYRNLRAPGLGDFRDAGLVDNVQYWTSSQQTADMANHIDFADLGRLHYDDKDFPRRVRAIRAI